MNYSRLPQGSRGGLPAPDTVRQLAPHYRGAGTFENEPREAPLRATLLRYLNLALKYKVLIALFAFAAMFVGVVATFMTPGIYTASTSVKIDRLVPKVVNSQSVGMESGNDPQFYQTQYELIRSRSLAERVAVALNLGQSDFVDLASKSSPLIESLSPTRLLSQLLADAEAPPERDAAAVKARQDQAVGMIMAGLGVRPVAMSSVVRISFSSTDPAWAQRISVALAEQYERSTLDRRFSASNHARNFLDERLQQLKVKLQDSERQLVEYAQKHSIVSIDDKRPETLANLQAVQNALAQAITTRLQREQLWYLARANNGLSLPQVVTDTIIQQTRARIALMQANYQEKLSVLKPAFPEMMALRTQITEAENQVRAQIDVVRNAIRLEFEAARAQEQALEAKLEEVKAEVLDVRGRSIEYTILMREVDTARSLYDGLLSQFRELGVAGDVDTNNVSIIDRAQVPRVPDSPSLRKNLLISLFLGLLAAAAFIGVREALDDTFNSVAEVEEALNLAVLGVAPMYRTEEEARTPIDELRTNPTSPLSEAYRSLRTALQFSTEDGTPKTLLITSSRPGEGKSTTSIALSLNFAQLGMKVLLIDADLRNPNVHRQLQIENSEGLSNYLAGGADSADLVRASGIDGVTVLTSGPPPPNPAELLAGPRFGMLLSAASENFDTIIVDGPPVMNLADAPIISSLVHGTLLVIEAASTRRGVVIDTARRLDFARARVVGALLNKFDARKTGFNYAYGYGYGDGYGYGSRYGYGERYGAIGRQASLPAEITSGHGDQQSRA